jgi:hypothetical protein
VAFVDRLKELKQRDGLLVFAWSLLSNHYRPALQTSAVPLSRTMRALQGGFSRAFNRRPGRTRPLPTTRAPAHPPSAATG